MGGLSSGPGPGLCLLTLVVLIVAQQVRSAPVQEENLSPQSRAQGYYDGSSSELSTGCYYNFQHYGEGDRIITNEPCLNCTCHNRMLMCYLRVCPFTKAIGQNCTIEKKPGQCCPLITCPEVPVQLLTSSTTTEHSESFPHKNQIGYGQYGTAVGHLDDYGCKINGEFYTNGAQIPGNIDKPCEVCYCIRNRTACIMQECTLQVEGCIPVYEEGLCCPVRYQCDYEYNYNAITTEQPRPTPGLVLTTTTSGPFECQHDNKWYADGAMVETEDSCEHCYCMKGDIVCAVQECKPPFEKDGHNCTAMPPAPGKCCPDSYHCDGNEIVDESEPTFRQDRMHKFGQNNANITMSITSSTSSGDKQHGWHYGTSSNENEMPNRFTDEHDKDGTKKPGKPTSDSDMMVTEGVPPTTGPLESGSHHIDGHGEGSGVRPQETQTGMQPLEGQSSTGQGHGVNTDNMLTISQVIQSIVQNQTNLFNQNKVNHTGKPEKPPQYDDKIVFPTDLNIQKKPGMDFQTDEDGNPIEAHSGTTEFPNEYYGLTGSLPNIYAEQSGRPQKKPTTHKKPGTSGSQGSIGQPVSGESQDFGGHQRPEMTHTIGEHGMTQHPQKKPIIHEQPGMADTLVVTDDEGNPIEIYEGATGKPEMAPGQPGSSGIYSAHGEKERPEQPGMQEGFTRRPDSDGIYSSLGEYGQSQKRPTIHKKPADVGEDVMGSHDFSGKPGNINQQVIFAEDGHTGRPYKKPITHKKPGAADEEMVTETYEEIMGNSTFTGKPVTDQHGRPLSQPGSEVMTDEDGVFHGKPQKIPSIHKRPGGEMSEDDITEGYQTVTETVHDLTDPYESEDGFTGRPSIHEKPVTHVHGPDGEYIYYDKYGKPYKRPAIHKRPGAEGDEEETHFPGTTKLPDSLTQENTGQDKLNVASQKPQIHITPGMTAESDFTDEDGNPIEEIAVFPGADEFEIFYDKYGRPHKRPTTHNAPTEGVVAGEHGAPVDGVESDTDHSEGLTGKPGSDGYQIIYDQYGRPHKRPITHKKPVPGVLTDEHGEPVDGMEGVTEFPESFTGKPEQDPYQIFYDEHGQPHKRPITHKKPVSGILTDEHGKPVDGVEGVTDFPEGFTGKPEQGGYQIFYDQHGRPHKRPITHKKPVPGVLTDEHGEPVDGLEGVTEFPESFTGKPEQDPYQIFYDEHGRPHKRPITHKKPVPGVLTDEHGKPVDGVEGVTEYAENFTGKPGTEDEHIFFDTHGRPHKRPVNGVLTDELGKPVNGAESVTDFPEGFTGKPEQDEYQIYYDQQGRPHKRPITHKKPVTGVLTDEHGEPVDGMEGVTRFPEGFTGKPEQDGYQIFYDEHGRPQKRPVIHKKPGDGVLTDEHDKPVDGVEGVTEYAENFTGKPGTGDEHIFYDEHGRPHKRPVTDKKPVSGVLTDEHGKPVDGVEGVTDFPEGFTGKPEQGGYQIFYDQHGRPHKRPITHKKPVPGVLTDEHGEPVDGMEGVTEFPESFTGKPEQDPYQIFYDEHGRPHKRPITHKKPVPGVLTDEHGKPVDGVEGVTEYAENFTGKPGTEDEHIFFDTHGRPHKRPITHKKPVPGVLTDEHGKPVDGVEGVTDFPESFTRKPGSGDEHILYDEHGRPHKRPVIHKKPGMDGVMLPDSHETAVDSVTKSPGHVERPEHDGITEITTGYGHTGKPDAKPGQFIPKPEGVDVVTDGAGSSPEVYEGTTITSEKKPDSPIAANGTTNLGELDVLGQPHMRPDSSDKLGSAVDEIATDEGDIESYSGVTYNDIRPVLDVNKVANAKPVSHFGPGENVMTDEQEQSVEVTTHIPEEQTDIHHGTGSQVLFDEDDRPHGKPVVHKKPGENFTTEEKVKPGEDINIITEIPQGLTDKPESDSQLLFYDQFGPPYQRPVAHEQPGEGGMTDEHGKPVDGVEGVTEYAESFTGKPGTGDEHIFYDEHGRPHKRPVTDKKPVSGVLTDEHGKPVDGVEGVTDFPEGFTGKPEQGGYQIFYDQHGRPHKRPITHKKPVPGVLTDEHGEPVDGMEGVTEYAENFTGKPGTGDEHIFYDEHGRPHKRPITHKKPGDGVMIDEHGEPVDKLTEQPDSGAHEVLLHPYGRPVKKPITPTKPEGIETGEDHDGTTESFDLATTIPESFSEGMLYDNLGRPQKKPGVDNVNEHVLPQGKPQQGQTQDSADHGHIDRPHSRPSGNKEPSTEFGESLPEEGESFTKDPTEGIDNEPGVEQSFFGETGRPQKKPVLSTVHKDPSSTDTTEDPVQTDTVSTEAGVQIFYDGHGRPHKKPVTDTRPGMTDESESPIIGATESPDSQTPKPGSDEKEIFYDEYGKPHTRPISHVKPDLEGTQILTDETDQRPIEKPDTPEIDTPEEQSAILENDKTHLTDQKDKKPAVEKEKPGYDTTVAGYGQDGLSQKQPDSYPKPAAGNVTEKEPDREELPQIYGEHGHTGRPQKIPDIPKKPGTSMEKPMPEDSDSLVGLTTELPETDETDIIYDKYDHPHKRPTTDKKPQVISTSEYATPDGPEGITDVPEGLTGKPVTNEQQIYHDPYGRPHKKPVTHEKPEETTTDEHHLLHEVTEVITEFQQTNRPEDDSHKVSYDEHGRPYKRPVVQKEPGDVGMVSGGGKPLEEGDALTKSPEYNEVTDIPEGYTGKPGTEDEHIFYDEHGRPHKRPVTDKKPVSGVLTDEHGKPVDELEGVTDYPESFTGKPGTEDEHIFYDEHGRPHVRPITHKKPGMDGGLLPDSHGTSVDGVTKSPGHVEEPENDGITDIMIGYGYTGTPDAKPGQFIPGPEGISTTEKVGSMTKSPESSTSHSAQTGKPNDLEETYEHGKPVDAEVEPLGGQKKKPGYDETSEVHGEPDHHGRPQEKPQSHTKPSEHEQPEQEDEKHPVHDYQKPSDHLQPAVTEDNGTAAVEDLTETPGSGGEDQLMIFGEHGHTGRPHKRPVKPTVPGTNESEDISGTSQEKPEAPVSSQTQDVPVDGAAIDKISDIAEDHVATDKKKPELESDETATTAPEKAISSYDKDEILHQKPDTEESKPTGDTIETSDKGITPPPDQYELQKPIGHPDEERPGSHSPDESVTEKPGDDTTEIYDDNIEQPQKRPVHSRPSGTDQMLEAGVTDLPTISSEHGLDDDQHKPQITSIIDGVHSIEGTSQEKPDDMAKPGSADGDEKKPEFDEGEPTHVSHPEKPHTKPVLKPESDTAEVTADETEEPETGTGLTEKPEAGKPHVYHEETESKPWKPATQDIEEGIESTTKLPSGAVHDTKTPGVYGDQTPVDHKPEENEIFGVPEKDVTGVDDDSVTKLPEVPVDTFSKLPTSQKKPTVMDHTGSSGTVITPEGDQANIDDDTATEEDDESLVITTDESGEDETEVHAKPESDAEGKPFVTTPQIPSHIVPGQQGSTPGLGSEPDDFTTPAFGAHDSSGAPDTEKDGAAHVTSGKPEEHVSGMNTGFDGESKPDDVTTPKGISETLSSTTEQVVSEKDHAKPTGADKTSAPTGSTPVPEDDGDESHVPEKDLNKGAPGGISETAVGHGDTHPDILPTQDTDGVTSPDASLLPEVITPVSTPEGTHGVSESAGSVPSSEMHPVISSTSETPGKVSETKPAPYQPPQIFIPYLPPDDGSSTKHPILIDEALHESSAPFDDIINNLANILRPSQTTEEPEGTTEDHGDVPGEGSCFMDGVTYRHNEDIPPLSPCHTKCTCISSIIHCLSLKCPPPPEDVSHCTVVHEENSCCPIYVCGTDVSPTLPVENHEGETTTDSSADKDESVTVHGYEPSKPTKPEVTESEDSSHTDQETSINHETDDKTSQESKPGVVGESKKPQVGSDVPEESDKGTSLTERPEEDSVAETHTSQEKDHVMSSKPESTVIETSTESKIPTKTTEVVVTPDTVHVRPWEPQSGYHPILVDDQHPSTTLPIYFGTGKPELPHQSHHKPESVDHVLDTDKPDHEGTEPSSAAESIKPQEDKQKPAEIDDSKPNDFTESATHRPVHHGTTTPVGVLKEDKTPEKDTAGEVELLKPAEAEKETEPSEPHEHDGTETETGVHSTLEEQEPVKEPVEKPDEITPSKEKPQSGQVPAVTGEEQEHQTTERPGEKEPQFHTGTTSEDEEIVHSTSKPHEKPEMDGKPSYMDETPAHTTVEPHGESPVTEQSYNKHQSTDEPENNFVQSSSQKPGLHEYTTPDLSAESDPSVKRPVTHEKPFEGEEHKPTSSLDADRPVEASETQKPGQLTSEVNGTETKPAEADVVPADKTHPGVSGPTYDTVNEGEEPSKKPEDSTDEPDQTLAYSTTQPVDHSESGKPLVSSGDTTDMHEKPQPGHQGGEETFVTSEVPHKELLTEIYPSPVSEDSENVTAGPHEEAPEDIEDLDEKHPIVHPPSMDNESAFTTEESSNEEEKPQGKPETEVHPTSTDEKSSTAKPDEEPSKGEHSQTKPESEQGLVIRPTEESAVVKKPAVSEKPVFGEKVPQSEQQTNLVHLTTESQMIDEKLQHAQDFSSTVRPKPTGVHGVSVQGELQTDDIPEEVLLHPTRTPGTYETERPDLIPEVEEDALPSQKPHIENENLATIFPHGIIRPITKKPIYGTGKPVVSDNKESTTPGYPFIQLGPQTNQVTGKPEETFEATASPIFDIMTDAPEDFAQLFGIKPSIVHGQQPDKYDKPEHTTHISLPDFTTGVSDFKPQTADQVKRPIHTTNGTHFIQYVPYKEGAVPLVPEGATLGELIERPDGQKYWPIIYMKLVTTTPGAEISQLPFKPIPQQVFNGTHFIQYVPYDKDKEPEVSEGAALGQPQKGPDDQIYWPIIGKKPIMVPTDKPVTEPPYPGQVFNGTHFIQYVPFREGQKPEVPEEATLGEPENAPNGQKYWPIISVRPIPEDDTVTSQSPLQSQPEQIFNGSHFIQFAPYNDGQEPEIPEEATLGQPQKGPDGQVYWPIIDTKPLPITPDKLEPTTEQPLPSVQVFNGTNFIQYVPFKDGVTPEVPEGATLGQPQKGPDGQMYWPIIYMRPRPVKPQGSFPEQVYNGTNFIQYVPYKEGHTPEVPSHATLGQPQQAPDGQMYWPIIYMKPVTAKPNEEKTTERPSQAPFFNGTHFIQYVPYMEGFEPDIPEEATLGKPEKRPDGETYWPIIYHKLPTRPKPETVQHYPGQFFNGTHFVQYLPYRPSHKPHVPEGVILSQQQKGPDGQMYWMIVSTKPLPTIQEKPTGPQFFNGTHFIQYVPYENEKEPEVPEGAALGKPEVGTGGQKFWPIIYIKPLSGIPITYQKPVDQDQATSFDPYKGQAFNGTHYVQYVPYKPGKIPNVPEGVTLGQPTKRPNGQLYWPIYYLRPVQGVPTQGPMIWSPYDYVRPQPEQVFNGTHFIQYLPYNPTRMPQVPEGATLGQPQKGPEGQMYWVIISDKPLPAQAFNDTHVVQYVTPVTPEQAKPQTDQNKPIQVFNGTHYIQYVPYTPGQKPVLPEGASLGQPTQGPEGQMYWPIIYMKPQPGKPTQQVPIFWGSSYNHVEPVSVQIFNGTHYIRFVKYDPSMKPIAPEGASISEPQRRPDGELYWVIASREPLSDMQVPVQQHPGQIFNGTHYIQYVPYNSSQMPQVPEGAILGHPQKGPEGQMYWVIISDKPLPAQPGTQYVQYVTPVTPEDEQMVPGPMFNGTHFIQYVPYKTGHIPKVPQDAILGELHKGPGGQMYWPIIYRKPPQSFNGTHYTPDSVTGVDSGKPSISTHHFQPINATSKPAEDHPFWSYGQYAPRPGNGTLPTVNKYPGQKPGTEEHAFWTYGHDKPQNGSEDSYSNKPTTENPSWSSGQIHNATKVPEISKLPSGQYGGGDHSKPGYEYESGYYKPEKPERPSTPEDSYEGVDEDHLIEYPSGSDYDETQEQPYGPGTCRYAGKVYVSAQQIPRDDPCDFCFCFRSDIICLQQSCPPPIPGCHEEPIQGFCCPRYECHVRMATLLNVTSTTTTTTTTLPPHFLSHVYKGAAGRTGCFIQGKAYRVGQEIPSASGPCMDCMCGGDGKMKCEPKVCTPEPMVRQMMVSSEKPTTAKHR